MRTRATDRSRALEEMSRSGDSARELVPAVLAFLLLYGALSTPLLGRKDAGLDFIAGSIVLAAVLAVLSAIDLYSFRLPDALTLPLTAAGLFVAWWTGATPLWWSAASAGLGFLLLAGFNLIYRYVRGRDGLGLGDAKLLAASGAWLGAGALPSVLLWATGSAIVCVFIASLRGGPLPAEHRLPFGPFLAFGTWLAWLYGPL